jgi:hypothetical protein
MVQFEKFVKKLEEIAKAQRRNFYFSTMEKCGVCRKFRVGGVTGHPSLSVRGGAAGRKEENQENPDMIFSNYLIVLLRGVCRAAADFGKKERIWKGPSVSF